MNINVQKELEVLLNEAAEVYDAPGMDQVAEHLAKKTLSYYLAALATSFTRSTTGPTRTYGT